MNTVQLFAALQKGRHDTGEVTLNRSRRAAFLAAVSLILLLGSDDLMAQAAGGRGRNRAPRDPAEMQARRMDRYREQLEVKNDDEWKVIQQRIEKVLQAESEVRIGGFGGFRGGGTNNGTQADGAPPGGGRGNRGQAANAESNPEAAALKAALDAKAPTDEIKAKLAKLHVTLTQKEANLAKVREELRQVLSVRQEALAVIMRLLR